MKTVKGLSTHGSNYPWAMINEGLLLARSLLTQEVRVILGQVKAKMGRQTCPEQLTTHQTSLIPLIISVHMAQIDMVRNQLRYERSQENSTSI